MDSDTSNILREIIRYLKFSIIDENDFDIQEYYYKLCDKLIDQVLVLHYEDDRRKERFLSVNQINTNIIQVFKTIDGDNTEFLLSDLVRKILYATKEKEKYDYYYSKLEELYSNFQKKGCLVNSETLDFYNEILNKQQNAYFSAEKKKLEQILTYTLPITEKRQMNLIRTAKLKKAQELIRDGNFDELGITFDELLYKLSELHKHLNSIKPFNKENITDREFKKLDLLFLNAYLLEGTISDFSKEKRKIILNKYSKLLIPYLDNITDAFIEIDSTDVEFNYNHLKFYDRSKTVQNITDLFSMLPREKVDDIYNNFDYYKEILKLLPLVNLLPNFSMTLYYHTIVHYRKIVERLQLKNDIVQNPSALELVNNLSSIIKLSKIYSQLDEYSIALLSEEVIEKIMADNQTSKNPADYIPVYLKMLGNKVSKVPQVSGEWGNYIFENDKNYDQNRLLIGKNSYRSCIGLNAPGEEAYLAALTDIKADVMMIKNKDTGKFAARIIMFRRGNFIIMAPIFGEKGYNEEFYNENFLSMLGNEILNKAIDAKDTINYVFLTKRQYCDFNNIPSIMSDHFVYGLPHCDLRELAYLIGRKKRVVNLDTRVKKAKIYKKARKEPEEIIDNVKDQLLHIKAVELYTAESKNKKEKIKQDFENIKCSEYKKAYIGQDWYIAIREDDTIEKVVLNNTKEVQKEIESVTDNLLEDISGSQKNVRKTKIFMYKK